MPRRQRLVFTLLLLAGIGMFVVVWFLRTDDGADVSVSSNPAVDRLVPERGAEVLQQQPVGIDLAEGYRVTSFVIYPNEQLSGGVEVLSQAEQIEGLNQWLFSPGEGRLVEALSPDTNCVVVAWEEIARPEETGSIDWCFDAA